MIQKTRIVKALQPKNLEEAEIAEEEEEEEAEVVKMAQTQTKILGVLK